jgi:hypothetical protein
VTGDCGEQEEKGLIARGAELRADVLKVGHHGSSSASSEIFLAAVRPSYAVISCGADNDYGHPSEKTLVKLGALAGKTYITRDCGTVTFVSDGWGTEYMHLFHTEAFHGTLRDCDEGELEWLDKKALLSMPDLWEGDRIFLRLMDDRVPFFSLKLRYEGDRLTEAVLNGKQISTGNMQ